MAVVNTQNQSLETAKKVRRTQKIIVFVMALMMLLPGLLAWYLGAFGF